MIIGVDADGVLTDMSGFNFKYGEQFFGHEPVNPSGYKTGEIFGENSWREFLFGLKYFKDYCCYLEPRKNAVKVNHRLNKSGNKFYVITARKFSTMKNPLGRLSRKLFRQWTEDNKFKFKKIFFCSEKNTPAEKLYYCKKVSADIMIDDKPDIALYLAENGIQVLLFDAPYNQGVEHRNIVRVYNWTDIYRYIEK